VRVQTTGTVSAASALATASSNVSDVCDHISASFAEAVRAFEAQQRAPVAEGGVGSNEAGGGAEEEEDEEDEDDEDDEEEGDDQMDED
jgi:hypothetical protein